MEQNEGQFKLGQVVGFKSDIEQYGRVIDVRRDEWSGQEILKLESLDAAGFIGDYIGGQTDTEMPSDRCWVDQVASGGAAVG